LAASTLIVLFSENLLEFSNFVFLNLSKILWLESELKLQESSIFRNEDFKID
jgi:hypothetical protein